MKMSHVFLSTLGDGDSRFTVLMMGVNASSYMNLTELKYMVITGYKWDYLGFSFHKWVDLLTYNW